MWQPRRYQLYMRRLNDITYLYVKSKFRKIHDPFLTSVHFSAKTDAKSFWCEMWLASELFLIVLVRKVVSWENFPVLSLYVCNNWQDYAFNLRRPLLKLERQKCSDRFRNTLSYEIPSSRLRYLLQQSRSHFFLISFVLTRRHCLDIISYTYRLARWQIKFGFFHLPHRTHLTGSHCRACYVVRALFTSLFLFQNNTAVEGDGWIIFLPVTFLRLIEEHWRWTLSDFMDWRQ